MIPSPNAGLMLAHCLRRWASIKPALVRSLVCAGDMSRAAFVMRWKRLCLLDRAVGTEDLQQYSLGSNWAHTFTMSGGMSIVYYAADPPIRINLWGFEEEI